MKDPNLHTALKQLKALDTTAPASPLRREEWAMFKDCPEEQLVPCLYYEYARHVREICEAVKRHRRCRDVSGLAYQGGFSLYLACVLFPFRRYFPQTPWLDLLDDERKAFVDLVNTKQYLNPFDWESQIHKGYSPCTGSVDKLKDKRFRNGKHIASYRDLQFHDEDGSPVTYFVHRVNWDKSDAVLIAEYREWLSRRQFLPRETRGKTSPRERLKALAALRWLKRSNWQQAARYTELELDKPLYVQQSEWIDAKRSAEHFLNVFGPLHSRYVG